MLRRLGGALNALGRAVLPRVEAAAAHAAPSSLWYQQLAAPQCAAATRLLWTHGGGFAARGLLLGTRGGIALQPPVQSIAAFAVGVRNFTPVRRRQTPGIKKPKKIKMRFPSSMKERFKRTGTGLFLRMRVGKRHCASAKSIPQKRRLRQKALVPPGLAKTMRKLSFKFAGSGRM